MPEDDRLCIHHMRDHAAKALDLVADKTRADFDADETLRLALTYLIQIIGEAASRVSRETKDSNREIPWHGIVGMRHRIVHGYFAVDDDLVWQTVTSELPPLIVALDELATTLGEGP